MNRASFFVWFKNWYNRSNLFLFGMVMFLFIAWLGVSLGWASPRNDFAQNFNTKVEILGVVVSDPVKAGKYAQRFEFKPKKVTVIEDGRQFETEQKILVTSYNKIDFQYGDEVLIKGNLKSIENFSEHFDYVHYLEAKGIFAKINSTEAYVLDKTKPNQLIYYGLKIKHLFYNSLQKNLKPEQGALLIALLVGDKGLMSSQIVNEFSITGVAHLIAVSSYILTVILILASRLRPYIGKALTVAICSIVIILSLIMADFSAGMLRAAIMFGLYILSKNLGKQYSVVPVVIFTAAILVAINPLIIKYDLGFLFSFSAILAIVLFAPIFTKYFASYPKMIPEKFGIREILATTLAAQIGTIPLTIYYFEQLPIISPLSNLIIVPIITPTILMGYFLVIPFISKLVAIIVSLPLTFILFTVHTLAKFKYASLEAHISSLVFTIIYALELGAYFLLRYLSK